jgi:mycoredoxin
MCAFAILFTSWLAPLTEQSEGEMSEAKKIMMYGANWCGDCRRAEGYLEAHGVPFTYVNVDEDPVAKAMIEKLTGAKSIPVIIFDDGSYLIEPSNDALGEKVGIVKS